VKSLQGELLDLGGDITAALEDLLMPAGLVDSNGTLLWQNEASSSLFGQRVGAKFTELATSDEQPAVRDTVTRIICGGEPAEFALHVRTAEGDYAPLEFSAVPVREGGAVVGIFGLTRSADTKIAPTAPPPETDLTERQVEVLRLLADGKSTGEIAAQL
jgi:PAS fold/Bacterial regulatory proteins, luxR family